MSGSLYVHVSQRDIDDVKRLLSDIKGAVPKVTRMAVNRTLAGVRTDAANEIAKVVTLSKTTIRSAISVKKLGAWNDTQGRMPAAYVRCHGKMLPLIFFKARQTKKGVTVQVKKSEPRSLIKHAFIATVGAGHRGVFWRKKWGGKRGSVRPGRKFGPGFTDYGVLPKAYRLPMTERFSFAVPDVMGHPPTMNIILDLAGIRLKKNLDQALNYYLSKLK